VEETPDGPADVEIVREGGGASRVARVELDMDAVVLGRACWQVPRGDKTLHHALLNAKPFRDGRNSQGWAWLPHILSVSQQPAVDVSGVT
jgi:hypothetical protein